MTKNSKRNTKNSNKNENISNKKAKTVPKNDSLPLKPLKKVISSSSNDKIPPNDDNFIKNVPTEKLSEK